VKLYSIHFDDASIVFKLDSAYSGTQLNDTVTGTEGACEITTEHHLIVDDSVFATIQVGSNNDAAQTVSVANVTENRITFNMADTTSKDLGISTIDLDSLGEVQSAINYLDAAIEKINDAHDNIGSLQNRLEFPRPTACPRTCWF